MVQNAKGGRSSRLLGRFFLLLAAVTLLCEGTGCSIRKLAYGWANRILVNRFTDTFDLKAEQKRELSARITALHAWHRRSELPHYVQIIDGIMSRLEDGLSREEVEWMLSAAEEATARLSARFCPEAAAVMSTLSDPQITHAVAEFKKGERERFEKLDLPTDDYINYRLKLARKNLKTWFGSYTDAQLAEFERFVRKNRIEEQRRRKRYQENEEALLAALRTHAGAPVIADLVHRWLTRQEVLETPEFQAAERRNQADFVDLVLTLDRLMTSEQRRHLLRELAAWRTDFSELSSGI